MVAASRQTRFVMVGRAHGTHDGLCTYSGKPLSDDRRNDALPSGLALAFCCCAPRCPRWIYLPSNPTCGGSTGRERAAAASVTNIPRSLPSAMAPQLRFDEMHHAVGRSSIPRERLLKASLLMALHTVCSERMFREQLDYNLTAVPRAEYRGRSSQPQSRDSVSLVLRGTKKPSRLARCASAAGMCS